MPVIRQKGPTEEEWAFHREQLTHLYMKEKKPLHEVKEMMAAAHGFIATKSQYEKYLNRWNLRKKTKPKIWRAIAPVIQGLDHRGQRFEVWIDNERKSDTTVRKETRRYSRTGSIPLEHAILDELPPGVVIREISSYDQPRGLLELPFLTLERHLGAVAPIIKARHSLGHLPVHTTTDSLASSIGFNRKPPRVLDVVALEVNDLKLPFDIIRQLSSFYEFTSSFHRNVLFSLANNFAGLRTVPANTMLGLLRQEMIESSLTLVRLSGDVDSLQAIAQSLYRSALEAGNMSVVANLLGRSIAGVKVNCFLGGVSYPKLTPLEIAVEANNIDLVKLLLHNGADPNLVFNSTNRHQDDLSTLQSSPLALAVTSENRELVTLLLEHGADPNLSDHTCQRPLDIAISCKNKDLVKLLLRYGANPNWSPILQAYYDSSGSRNYRWKTPICQPRRGDEAHDWIATTAELEIFEILINNGAELCDRDFRDLVECDKEGHFTSLLLSRGSASEVKRWYLDGILHDIFKFQAHDVLLQALEIMCRHSLDLNLPINRLQDNPRILIDIVAARGNLTMLELLVANGATLTNNTLVQSTRSTNACLVRWVLDKGSNSNHTELYWDRARAAAILSDDDSIYGIVDSRCPRTMQTFTLTLEAASHMGKWSLFKHFFNPALRILQMETSDRYPRREINMMENALLYSLVDEQDSLAVELLNAGFCDSAARGHLSSGISSLLRERPSVAVDRQAISGESPLSVALKRRNTTMINLLLDAVGIGSHNEKMDSILLHAAEWGDLPILRSIIDSGLKIQGSRDCLAINVAISRNDKDTLDLLLYAGMGINNVRRDHNKKRRAKSASERAPDTITALETAVQSANLSMVEYVLQRGADPHDPHALSTALATSPEIFDLLLRRHVLVYPRGRKGWGSEILCRIISKRDLELFKTLVCAGADANEAITDIHTFDWSNQEYDNNLGSSVEADENESNSRSYYENLSPFGYSIVNMRNFGIEFADYLLLQDICRPETIVSSHFHKDTAFLTAIETANLPAIQLLIRHKANVDFPAKRGIRRTPLQQAAEGGNLEIVQLLLDHGADVNGPAALRGGATALQLASIKGYIRITLLLLRNGADVHAPAAKVYGRTALEGAAEHGRLDTVALLLQHHGKYDSKYEKEFTRAIAYAEDEGFDYIADLLRRHQMKDSSVFSDFIDFDPSENEGDTS